ncbi:alpha/beta fold hydrolase [Caproiciproducens sp. MSJ-32]|uniref:alpha/beta fold hydrolase n=1 Tax=Caproiciproducens sp. MSJ-32 TaxID=2841527 RepID=UPI001C0F44D0|nr:alpha/beta hydrolase [Caproiciproducens sp. MSJ-32]
MPYVKILDKNIYYREYGSGEPIVFLNGMMMSTSSWTPFAKIVSKDYRMITVDLLDQGRSDSCEDNYTIDTQVEFLNQFLKKLNLKKVHILGTSYGGKVALTFAIKHPTKVKSLILSNTDSYTTNIMRDIGRGWIYGASTLDGEIFSTLIMPYIYSYHYYEKNYEEIKAKGKTFEKMLNEEWYQRFKRGIESARNFNVYDELKNIKSPTLIISSEFDIITPIGYQKLIHEEIEGSKWIIIKRAGHASMYEKPEEFISIVMDFLESIKNIQ